jgi:hypothetical protein
MMMASIYDQFIARSVELAKARYFDDAFDSTNDPLTKKKVSY